MLTGTKIALAAAVVAIMSSPAPARHMKSSPANIEVPAAAAARSRAVPIDTDISAQRGPVRQSRNAKLNTHAPVQNGQISSGVGADNYQNWHQACCL
jgi:hypothetical protein